MFNALTLSSKSANIHLFFHFVHIFFLGVRVRVLHLLQAISLQERARREMKHGRGGGDKVCDNP